LVTLFKNKREMRADGGTSIYFLTEEAVEGPEIAERKSKCKKSGQIRGERRKNLYMHGGEKRNSQAKEEKR